MKIFLNGYGTYRTASGSRWRPRTIDTVYYHAESRSQRRLRNSSLTGFRLDVDLVNSSKTVGRARETPNTSRNETVFKIDSCNGSAGS